MTKQEKIIEILEAITMSQMRALLGMIMDTYPDKNIKKWHDAYFKEEKDNGRPKGSH